MAESSDDLKANEFVQNFRRLSLFSQIDTINNPPDYLQPHHLLDAFRTLSVPDMRSVLQRVSVDKQIILTVNLTDEERRKVLLLSETNPPMQSSGDLQGTAVAFAEGADEEKLDLNLLKPFLSRQPNDPKTEPFVETITRMMHSFGDSKQPEPYCALAIQDHVKEFAISLFLAAGTPESGNRKPSSAGTRWAALFPLQSKSFMRWKEHKKSFASLKEDAASLNPSDLDGMGPPVGKKRARDDSDDDDDGDNGEEEEEEEDAGNDDEDDDDEKENGSDSLPEQWDYDMHFEGTNVCFGPGLRLQRQDEFSSSMNPHSYQYFSKCREATFVPGGRNLRKILLWTGMTSIPNFSTRHNDGMLLSYLLWDRVGCVVEGALQQRQASASASASAYPLSLREVLESIQIIQAHDFSAVQVIHNQCLNWLQKNGTQKLGTCYLVPLHQKGPETSTSSDAQMEIVEENSTITSKRTTSKRTRTSTTTRTTTTSLRRSKRRKTDDDDDQI